MSHKDTPWWRGAAIYQVYPRSFADGNGDGVGDLAGIRARLPYLRDLGIDAIWFNPWYASPMADAGYDVADYRAIEPVFGDLAEAELLISEARELGIRVIVDVVPNHVSDQHPWFQAALAAGPGSPERELFWFRPGRGDNGELPPTHWPNEFLAGGTWTRVSAAGTRSEGAERLSPAGRGGDAAGTRSEGAERLSPAGRGEIADGEWYLHLFDSAQPDLNWEHPVVRAEFEAVLRFWFDRGAAGIRVDSAALLAKDADLPEVGEKAVHPFVDRDDVHEIYRSWRRVAEEYGGDRALIGEVWMPDPQRFANYLRPDELHTAFNLSFLACAWDAAKLREVIVETLATHAPVGAPATWVLSNHDVTRHVTRYGREDTSFSFAAKRHDTPFDLELGIRRARAAILLALALPGAAYLYQGEELGLWEVEDIPAELRQDPMWFRSGKKDPGRDGCRVPLPWSGDEAPFGFSPEGAAGRPWLPQPAAWKSYTAEVQTGDPHSMLELCRSALRLRRTVPGFGDGPLTWLDSPPETLAFAREAALACVVNLSDTPVDLPAHDKVLLTSAPLLNGTLLPTDTAVWLHLT